MQGKTVVITGGNTGIGKETARELARMGARVVIGVRNTAKGESAAEEIRRETSGDVRVLPLDLASFASVRAFAEQILATCERIDVLILNAGLVLQKRQETVEGIEATFGINHLGHFLLTELLLERVRASAPARILVLASDAHRGSRKGLAADIAQRTKYSAMDAYCDSKLANVLFTRELARRLEGTSVTVNAVHPGVVATEFARGDDVSKVIGFFTRALAPFFKTAAEGAQTSIYLASSPEVAAVTGSYFVNRRPVSPSKQARDDNAARWLWEESERLIAIKSR